MTKVYEIWGPLFFGSVQNFNSKFDASNDPQQVEIDFIESKVTKDTLDDKHVKWEALKKFCVENKVLGYKRLTDKIGLSYIISPMALNEIKNIIK